MVKLMEKASLNSKYTEFQNRTEEEFEKEKKTDGKEVCKITLYQNGFRVNDDDFRPYSDESSKQFMAELNKG